MTATFAPRPQPRPQPGPEPRPQPHKRSREAAPAPRPHLWLVGQSQPRQRRVTRLLTGALVVAVCALLFGIVALRVVLAQGQGEIDRLTESIEAQQAVQQDLRLAVAELEAPAQVVAAARQRLGMVTPGTVTYLPPPPPAGAPAR